MLKIIKLIIIFSILIISLKIFKNIIVEDIESNYFALTMLIILIFCAIIFLYRYMNNERIKFKNKYRILVRKNLINEEENENILFNLKFYISINEIKDFQKYLVLNLPKYINLITFLSFISIFILIFNFLVRSLLDIDYAWSNLNYGLFSLIILVYYTVEKIFSKKSNQEKYSSFIGIGEFDFNITNLGVERSNKYFKSFYKWECIKSCVISEELLFFMFSKYEGLIVPLNQLTVQTKDELLAFIEFSFE